MLHIPVILIGLCSSLRVRVDAKSIAETAFYSTDRLPLNFDLDQDHSFQRLAQLLIISSKSYRWFRYVPETMISAVRRSNVTKSPWILLLLQVMIDQSVLVAVQFPSLVNAIQCLDHFEVTNSRKWDSNRLRWRFRDPFGLFKKENDFRVVRLATQLLLISLAQTALLYFQANNSARLENVVCSLRTYSAIPRPLRCTQLSDRRHRHLLRSLGSR